ncbi:MAG: D-alanyl-D-alanine carboxypeptidase/D-alanyl-D-alanine-endopeptidase [Bacteroidales bacterium]
MTPLRSLRELTAVVVLLAIAAPRAEAPETLASGIEKIMARPEFKHAMFGVAVLDADSGAVLYAKNGGTLFVPGSTTKLVSVGSALGLLGPDYRFHTRVYRTGLVVDGTLQGDLVLVASGDPNLSNRARPDGTYAFVDTDHSYGGAPVEGDPVAPLRDLAAQVAARGIKRVAGRVIVDVSLYREGEREGGTGVVISPIMVNDNLIDATALAGPNAGDPVRVELSPFTSYLHVDSRLKTVAASEQTQVRIVSDVENGDGSHTLTVEGRVPAGKTAQSRYNVPRPSRFAEFVFAEALQERGIVAAPRVKEDRVEPLSAKVTGQPDMVMAEHVSLPLIEAARVILKVSQNLHASSLPYLLGAVVKHGDLQAGFDAMKEWLAAGGLDVDAMAQSDGAGAAALYTPLFMARYVAWIARQPFAAGFERALPILGKDGTLATIQAASPAADHVFAKTGTYSASDLLNRRTIVNGKGLAGYTRRADGRRLAIAIYVNQVAVPSEPDAANRIAGQALGEIAALTYDSPLPRAPTSPVRTR